LGSRAHIAPSRLAIVVRRLFSMMMRFHVGDRLINLGYARRRDSDHTGNLLDLELFARPA
jgi:hypothetical protein